MEFLPPDDRHRSGRLLARAARDVTRLRRPDALLALVLRVECELPPDEHPALHRLVAARARALDTRVLAIIADEIDAIHAAIANPHLGVANAEWLAVLCIARILPATSMAEWEMNRTMRGALQ